MDNVLFYGERDEQTRRQVRSAAAAHSHRIGPRKPKATLRQSASTGSSSSKDTPPKRRTAQQKPAVKQEPASSTVSSPQNVNVQEVYRTVPSVPPQFRDLPVEQSGLTQMTGFQGQPQSTGPIHLYPQHLPAGALEQPRNGLVSPGLRSMSPAGPTSSPDSTQRLPQYSWTEYPRYGLGSNRLQSLEMLADVASSARNNASRLGSPAEQGIPGLRHFESSAEGRPILPPLLPTSSPHLQQSVDGDRQGSAEAQNQNSGTEPPSRQAAKDPCLGFGQHARPHFNPLPPG
ncbi:hypothetical protein Slin15195_G103160 [Septoria linicola]|uniref:Uncharacterized protein n=1 Tax=Septoria linicola TaxID=215465 RepID=A0A9Q9B416_9PEZI|nr:hypothetical protein Slin15195_G103160 [Septoria linicola]